MQAIVLAVPMTAQVPAVVARLPSMLVDLVVVMPPARYCAQKRRQSVQAPSRSPVVAAGHHRPGDELDRRHVGRGGAHELGRHRLVAAADQHDRVHRLGADHLLDVHRHEVAEHHAGRIEEDLAQRDRRELDRQAAGGEHAALHGLDQLGKVPVAVVEAARRLRDADDRTRQHLLRVAHRRRERAAQVEREVGVAVVGPSTPAACPT